MRIAFLSPCFWPEVRRGTERVVRDLADGLIARGHRPRLITSHPGLPRRAEEDGLAITRHWRPPEGLLRRRGFEEHMTHVPFSYLSLHRGQDDLAHAFYVTEALAAARWGRRTGRPTVLSYMGIPDWPGITSRRLRLRITRSAVRESAAVVALSRTAAETFSETLGIEARVIHPGVDLQAFTPGPGRAGVPTVFCAAAIEEPRKRVELLVAAFRLVRRQRREARLVLARPRDPGVAQRLEASRPGIELRSVDDSSALVRAYREAWVSVLPSVGEAFGLVLAEALACGTPVVGTNAGGIREIVDRETVGRLFDGDDERALAEALLEAFELAEDPSTPAACRERAQEFSTDRMTEAHLALYAELLGRAPSERADSLAARFL